MVYVAQAGAPGGVAFKIYIEFSGLGVFAFCV